MTNQLRLLFLFVVISGALCTVEDYVIMSQCAHNKAINLAAEGTVSVTDISQTQNITIVGRPDFVNNNFKIALYAKETQRYLCFNDHWKLVGMKELQDTCYFNEAIVHGYFVFRSVVDLQRRIGFTQRGRAVGPKKTVNDACYMFTKIPADQFFHQHTHFSAPKTKSTTKIPKTEYTNAPHSVHPGRGSGGGRPKQNRPKSQHRQVETVPNNNNTNKKNKKQRNGNKQRQKKQDMQQIRGHSYNLSNPNNSTYLNSSRQNLELSQHSINNHAKQHNHHLPQNHQVRHHHNDPKKVARRQQHDQKQKTKLHQRVRPSPLATTPASSAPSSTTPAPTSAVLSAATTIVHSTKPQYASGTSYAEINPTSVVQQISTIASANRNMLSSTVVVTKRKGRRRKGEKMHKKSMQKKVDLEQEHEDHSAEVMVTKTHGRSYSSSTSASYDDEEYRTSSTDNVWLNNDIMMGSIKPTSASLPTWETWYPSSSTSVSDENSSLSSSVTATIVSETDDDIWISSTRESSSMTDIKSNTLSMQTTISLPTAVLTTTQIDNDSDETISPTETTDFGTTTTNTSTYSDEIDAMFATLKLNDDPGIAAIESYWEDTNLTESIKYDSENSTALTTEDQGTVISSFATEEFTEVSDTTSDTTHAKSSLADNDQTSEIISSVVATIPTTYTNDCANSISSSMNESKTTTDCLHASNTAAIANKHKNCRHRNSSVNSVNPKRYFPENSETKLQTVSRATTTRLTLETTPTRSEKTTTTSTTASLSKSSPAAVTATQYPSLLSPDETLTAANNVASINATPTLSPITLSTKSLVPSPSTTRKTLRKSTQRLLATPFHQLTYVRNEAGGIDIDNLDNISMYPELLDYDNDETAAKPSTSRLTLISGYLPTSATATLPESIRLAKIKINRARRRMSRLRSVGNYA